MVKRTIRGSRAIVTGASSGIGRAVARELGRQGALVVVTARRRQPLSALVEELAALGATCRAVAGDITEPSIREECLAAAMSLGGLDILVNNAGVGAIGPFTEADESRLRQLMEVNFFAPVELIRAAVPLLEESAAPVIANIGSVLGHCAVPWKSEYCASKFALHGFSDALRGELAGRGIDVLLVSPSTTDTEFFDNAFDSANGPRRRWAMTAESVARKTVRAIRHGRHSVIFSWGGRALVWSNRFCPFLVDRLLTRFAVARNRQSNSQRRAADSD
jgi:short-subunit dehydrogenase